MLWQYFEKGGVLMYPLLLCSIIALGLALERAFYFARLKFNPKVWFEKFIDNEKLNPKDVEVRLQQLKEHPLKRVLIALWNQRNHPREDLEDLAKEEAEEQIVFLEKNLKTLSVIAILSPLLGLLGTVLGIMKAFLKTSEASKIDPALLAGGIWEALITTFVGLSIAIPTWAVYYYFTHQVDHKAFQLEYFSSRFLRFLSRNQLQKDGV